MPRLHRFLGGPAPRQRRGGRWCTRPLREAGSHHTERRHRPPSRGPRAGHAAERLGAFAFAGPQENLSPRRERPADDADKMGYRVLRLHTELIEKQPREALARIRAGIGLP